MSCSGNMESVQVFSPDKNIELKFKLHNSQAYYQVSFKNKPVVNLSRLGFEFKNQKNLDSNFEVVDVKISTENTKWQQVWGEKRIISNHYNMAEIKLQEKSKLARTLSLKFKVYNDGLGFRYEIPQQKGVDSIYITNELTEFNLAQDYSTWFNPANFDSYEMLYQNKPASKVESANTPVTFESEDQKQFLSIHEANLTNYAGMTLKKTKATNFQANLVPWPNGVKVKAKLPLKTPWRTIQLADKASGLIESSLILNLNEPNKLEDVSWIKPSKYIGIWWGMHLGTQTWTLGDRHGATTKNMKQYIDFAHKNNIPLVLAEGWSTGWEQWGTPKAFDFVTPYKDFDLKAIVAYAKERGVGIIGHHETGGDSQYYEEQMDKAFSLYRSLGMHNLKTGYAGGIVPRGQFHHGQYMVNHYRKVVETAAKYQITINAHEPIKPTGIRRTYPNMMTREGARGMEWNGWSDGNPPAHLVTLPFTRILAGPMDYTPGIFDLLYKNAGKRIKWNGNDKGTSRINTTLAKQLAMYVILYSPMQMASDLIKNYEGHPAFQFFRDVPANWQDTKVLNAKIGEYLTIARKDWDNDNWFIGSATNEKARECTISLDFLDADKKYEATIYADGEGAQWKTNPYAYKIEKRLVTSKDKLSIKLAEGGGQAISLIVKK